MPFDNPKNDFNVAEAVGPFPKLLTDAPASDDVLRCLIEGRALIAKGWCQRAYAQNAAGTWVDNDDASAVAFCTAGVLYRLAGADAERGTWLAARDALMNAVPPDFKSGALSRHIAYSDAEGRTHAEVIAMWDRAISARRAEIER